MANWPSTLPDFRLPLNVEHQDGAIRTSMETGAQKVRRRFSATSKFYKANIRVNGTQLDTLDAFYFDTLQGGSLVFDMADPISGVTREFRFREPFTSVQRIGNPNVADRVYDVSMNLERLP